jgi:hypothetical protein
MHAVSVRAASADEWPRRRRKDFFVRFRTMVRPVSMNGGGARRPARRVLCMMNDARVYVVRAASMRDVFDGERAHLDGAVRPRGYQMPDEHPGLALASAPSRRDSEPNRVGSGNCGPEFPEILAPS